MILGNQSSIDKFYCTSWQLLIIPILQLICQRHLTTQLTIVTSIALVTLHKLWVVWCIFTLEILQLVIAFIIFRCLLLYCGCFMLQIAFLPSLSPALVLHRCYMPRAEIVFSLRLDPRWRDFRWYFPSPASVVGLFGTVV